MKIARNRYSLDTSGTRTKAIASQTAMKHLILADREHRLVRAVGGLELSGFAVEHLRLVIRAGPVIRGYTRSMCFSPNSPSGLISRNTSAST